MALLLVLALLSAPVEYVTHEGAHYVAAKFFGAKATLHFDRVLLQPGARFSELQKLLFAAAGPAVDWIVGLAALALLLRRFTPMRLVLAIWVARPLQFVPGLLGIDLSPLDGTDEGVVAAALGLPPQAIIGIELAAAVPLLALIVWCVPASGRLATLMALALGILLGWAGWLRWGAILLP